MSDVGALVDLIIMKAKDEQGNNAWISLVVNFKTKKQADIPLELIDAEVLEAFGLPSDFNEKMKEVE